MSELKGTPAQGLFGATLAFFIGFAAVALFGPTASRFQQVMHLDPLAIGFLVAMPSLPGSRGGAAREFSSLQGRIAQPETSLRLIRLE